MPFDAKVLRILIASPGDVQTERSVIPDVINDWNASYASEYGIVLMPIRWETHAAPMLGARPQEIINNQIVKDCDILVGVFWTRIGTPTGISVSGTAEEIEQFVEMGKPTMLYFSQSPIDPSAIDLAQFTSLRAFMEKMRLQGLTETYSGIPDFRQKFARQIAINLNQVIARVMSPDAVAEEEKKQRTIKKVAPKDLPSPDDFEDISLSNDRVIEYVKKAVATVSDNHGWSALPAIGLYLSTYTPVDYKAMGFSKLGAFMESLGLFDTKIEKRSPNAKAADTVSVRLRA